MFDKVSSRPATRKPKSDDAPVIDSRALLRLPQVLKLVPVSKTTWWERVASGEYPRPLHQGRSAFWPAREIFALIERIEATRDEA